MRNVKIERALDELVGRHGLDDHAWLKTLEEFDEPPLFDRADEVAFLSGVPEHERGPLVTRCMVGVLDSVSEFLANLDQGSRYYASITFMNWDLVRDGTQLIPRASLFVSPCWERELPDFRLTSPTSVDSRRVQAWVSTLGRIDLGVAESAVPSKDEPKRVYVGYRDQRVFKSVGDFLVSVERGLS